ncbi:MAG: ABC transporter substrate-binding protein [Butyrivibrio sp.]|nr:ABC transporter substrate-binding protein [Acetatifactor muris]MCM1558599.1 ABC transporter substrate-binding protein [Butyrivibrio sp.]
MNKVYNTLLFIILYCILLAGCGKQGNNDEAWRGIQVGADMSAVTERTEYYDIIAESEQVFPQGLSMDAPDGSSCIFLCTLFYGEEPVQLWAAAHEGTNDGTIDIWLYRSDGSRELLLQKISEDYIFSAEWYPDQDGNYYYWINSAEISDPEGNLTEILPTSLKKLQSSGEVVFSKEWEYGHDITDFCQLPDGRIYLIMEDKEAGSRKLLELDPSTGVTAEQDKVSLENSFYTSGQILASGSDSLFLLDTNPLISNKISEINITDGSMSDILSFTGTSYSFRHPGMILQDFRMPADESIVMLWTESGGTSAICEKLRMSRVEKTPITLRGKFNGDSWITEQVSLFNRSNSEYHVILEDCGGGNDPDDFARLTSVQIAAGKGPDILYGGLMQDYIVGMMEKNALEDLSPYMEKSGLREEDFFPFTFSTWREGERIYGINVRISGMYGYRTDAALLGGYTESDIHTLTAALLSCGEERIFRQGYSSQNILDFFLRGTETLWGMIDWEEGTCDFSGTLFAQILEIAARYEDAERNSLFPGLIEPRSFLNLFEFDGENDQKKAGTVTCGTLFDDGCHIAVTSDSTMAINANSAHKEGAWQFICFLLGEEAQTSDSFYVPVNRKVFDAWLNAQLKEVSGGKEKEIGTAYEYITGGQVQISITVNIYTAEDITEEKAAEYTQALEEARPYPLRTLPVLAIIREEAEDYFNGSKTVEEVTALISNRVQLYLDETR